MASGDENLTTDLASLRISRDVNPEGRAWVRWAIVLAVLAVVGVAGYAYVLPWASAKLFKTEVAVSEIAMVSPAQASTELTATGYVVPLIISHVGAKVPGRVAH